MSKSGAHSNPCCRAEKKNNWADREPSTERKTQLSTESRSNKGRIIVSDFSFTISLTLNSHRQFNVSERKIIEKKGKEEWRKSAQFGAKRVQISDFLSATPPHVCGCVWHPISGAETSTVFAHTRYEGFETNVLYRWGKKTLSENIISCRMEIEKKI